MLAEKSVAEAQKAGEALQNIVNSSERVMGIVRRVAAATEEQSATAEEVSSTMEHISDIINDHCGLAGEVDKSASSLFLCSQRIKDKIMYFKTGSSNISPATAEGPAGYSDEITS